MDLQQLVSESLGNTKGSLWPAFAPELILCFTIFALLLTRFLNLHRVLKPALVAMAGSLLALYFAYPLDYLVGGKTLEAQQLFTGMLVHDTFAVYIRSLLMLFAVLFSIFTWISGIPDQEDGADFYTLVLGSTLGMCLMATANHLLMVFMAVEMASVPSYALAATMKGRRVASEAALKYAVFGAGAAGVMLYGISLLAGLVGSAHLPTIASQLVAMFPDMGGTEKMVLALAGLMIAVGLSFKLSAVPFHFWCPDVFEGATAEVDAFLSIASKAAALALVVRMCIGIGTLQDIPDVAAPDVAASVSLQSESGLLAVSDEIGSAGGEDGLAPTRGFMALLWACIAAVTCTFGNLAAYGQTNIKRLLGYSTIAHAGYMLMTIPAALILYGQNNEAAGRAIGALGIYLGIYLFMNLAAFAIVAFLRNTIRSEEIADYAGLIKKHPGMVICMAIAMFSLVGLPPLAGFIGKFAIFASLAEGFNITGNKVLVALLVVGGLNTLISLFYYLRVVKVMAIDPSTDASPSRWSMVSLGGAFIVLVTAPMLLLFVYWNGLGEWTNAATRSLF